MVGRGVDQRSVRRPRRWWRCPCRRRCRAWRGRGAGRGGASSSTRVPRSIAPVAPSGWPIAMAPPLTLVISWVMPMSFMKRMATAAKASFISHRSMSSTSRPALASALRAAGAGPVSMIVGSAPETAVITIRARGVRPRSAADLLGADRHERGAVDDARRSCRRGGRGRSARPSGTSPAPRRRSRRRGRCSAKLRLEAGQALDAWCRGGSARRGRAPSTPLRSLTGTTASAK